MRTSTFILAASAALVAAQDIKPFIPQCSHKCLQDAASSASTCKIEPLDGKCVCAPATFEKVSGAAVGCVLQACGQEVALGQVLPGVQKYCEAALAGGSGSSSAPPTSAGSTSTAKPTTSVTSGTPTSAGSTSTAKPITSTSAKPTTSTSSPITSVKPTTGMPTTTTRPSGNSTVTPSGKPSSPAVPAGAASASAGFVGLLAAVGLGLFAL
ncbi:hypothetical protein GGTG_10953 [Gaeumannomyces tritici R3-111a-1]|uniref:CFEM domain-containing protein n=1 Tax=Gaeumannomyces tritici (strain R3-111a-1) TaxID=644352 RepID=J3PBT2_GAET3|nr:hypothetical protein GGTG_10953 [Gaeumannomyces tritici R3-111a-1]EJT71699.1 hypothetical protein GGTG_10953 [Gaeumannomyces tritici R3-111a-1]